MARDVIREIRGEIGRDMYGEPVLPEMVKVADSGDMPRRVNAIISIGTTETVEVVANLIGRDKSGKCVYELR